MTKFLKPMTGQRPIKVELQRLEKNFELYRSSENEVGLYFVDEVTGQYDDWMKGFSPDQIKVAAQKLRSLLYGKVSHLPMICQGHQECVYSHSCPFKPNEPVGKQCPYESAYVIEKINAYRDEFSINAFRETDYTLVSRLIELELFDIRLTAMISQSKYQKPIYAQVVSVSPHGEPIYEEMPNPMYEMKDKLGREKMKLLSILVETPEARYKKQAALKEVTENRYDVSLKKLEALILDVETKLTQE